MKFFSINVDTMEIIWEISLQTVEILTLIFGILGMTFSLMMLFSPSLTQTLSNVLNRNVNFEKKLEYLDKGIQIDAFVYNHNVLLGALFIAGSLFSLFFFFFRIDAAGFVKIFFGTSKIASLGEVFVQAMIWIARVACLVSLVFGTMLMFALDKMRRIDKWLNSWFETKSMIDKLDKSSPELDTFFFQHPFVFGLTGAIISFILIALSIVNLLN